MSYFVHKKVKKNLNYGLKINQQGLKSGFPLKTGIPEKNSGLVVVIVKGNGNGHYIAMWKFHFK